MMRIFLFLATNLAVLVIASITLKLLGSIATPARTAACWSSVRCSALRDR